MRRRFQPRIDGLECRDLKTGSGATALAFGGYAEVFGSSNGDNISITQSGNDVTVSVSNGLGDDTFTFPDDQLLVVVGGPGSNVINSSASVQQIIVGGTGNNSVQDGPGVTFNLSTGTGANTFVGNSQSPYELFSACSTGSTDITGAGAFAIYTLYSGNNVVRADAQVNWAYDYTSNDNTVIADPGQESLDVYTNNPLTDVQANSNTRVHPLPTPGS